MKKIILTIATIAVFAVGNSFAQSAYNPKGHKVIVANNSRIDNNTDAFKLNKLDQIVKLSRKQEADITKIENKYNRILAKNKRQMTFEYVNRLEDQKQKEILGVLTPSQRQHFMAYLNLNDFKKPTKAYRRG